MAAIRQSLRGAAAINPDPSVMLDAADRVLRSQAPERFVTAWVGVFDPVWSTLACAGAGHPPPLVRSAGGRVEPLPAGGLPLGLRERGTDVTRNLDLTENDTLLLYTDGLIEAGRDVIAGERALAEALRDADVEAAPAQAIHDGVLRGAGASDDVALLVVGFHRSLLAIGGDHGALRWAFDVDDGVAARAAARRDGRRARAARRRRARPNDRRARVRRAGRQRQALRAGRDRRRARSQRRASRSCTSSMRARGSSTTRGCRSTRWRRRAAACSSSRRSRRSSRSRAVPAGARTRARC